MPALTHKGGASALPCNPLATEISFSIPGAIRVKKNSYRIVRAGKFSKILPSLAYLAWHAEATSYVALIAARWRWNGITFPITSKVNCRATFFLDTATVADAAGLYQSIADWMEDNDFLLNDRQIVSWDGSRVGIDRKLPRVEICLSPVNEEVV